jgi:hypothetical protein
MPASREGRPLSVEAQGTKLTLSKVYVGDVWLYLSQSWHLGGPKELRLDDKSLPPICASAADVWDRNNHAQRPQTGPSGDRKWSAYQSPGRYYRNDAYYLGIGLCPVTKAPVGVIGLGASTLESMTPSEGFQAFEEVLGPEEKMVLTWMTNTPRGKHAYERALTGIEAWVKLTCETLAKEKVTFRDFSQPPALPGPPRYGCAPTTLYNKVIHRYVPMAVRGIIIQPKIAGIGDPKYADKAKALIQGLRAVFKREDLPVCFVQMHSPGKYEMRDVQDANDWVRLREAQNQLVQLPHTNVLATYDLKAPGRNEPDCGLRAAMWAAAVVKDASVKSGPVYKRHTVEGNTFIIEFNGMGGGLMAGEAQTGKPVQPLKDAPLGGFQIAGADGKWHDAKAKIKGDKVVVSCEEVEKPTAVRYAWTPEPKTANLYNREGFPALPFEGR